VAEPLRALRELIRELRAEKAELIAANGRLAAANERVVASNDRLVSRIEEMAAQIAALRDDLRRSRGESVTAPTVPSSQIPTYLKGSRKGQPSKPGRKKGHAGSSRAKPTVIDKSVDHEMKTCPHCDFRVSPVRGPSFEPIVRLRYVEDVIPGKPETTEHRVHQYWCRHCKRRVEPAVTAALPGSRIGLRVVVQTAFQHYFTGVTTAKIITLLAQEHGFKVTEGGLFQAWMRLAEVLNPNYTRILANMREAGVLHADETGWRVNGLSFWLWCFCTKSEVAYVIDRGRGGAIAKEFIGTAFDGTLVRDFYAAYEACNAKKTQFCLAHLLREFKKIEARCVGELSKEFAAFRRRVTDIIKNAIEFHRTPGHDPPAREAARIRFERRLVKVLEEPGSDPDLVRLTKRMWRSAEGLFTFLTEPGVDPTNNWAEQNIRPAVVMRKNSYGNRSEAGADVQAVLMSVFRTLSLQDRNVVEATLEAVRNRIVEDHREKKTASHG
jgi:transposase